MPPSPPSPPIKWSGLPLSLCQYTQFDMWPSFERWIHASPQNQSTHTHTHTEIGLFSRVSVEAREKKIKSLQPKAKWDNEVCMCVSVFVISYHWYGIWEETALGGDLLSIPIIIGTINSPLRFHATHHITAWETHNHNENVRHVSYPPPPFARISHIFSTNNDG